MTLTDLRPYVESAWGIDTTYTPDDWTPANPSRGQCATTSVYIVRQFGGRLFKGWVRDGSAAKVRHFWAVIDGMVFDWTWQQFAYPFPVMQAHPASESDLIADAWMQERYDAFAARVDAARTVA